MGSFVSQLATVAEIWRDEIGHYARILDILYRKNAKKTKFLFLKNA